MTFACFCSLCRLVWFFLCVFYGPSKLFHSFWAESIQRWGEKGWSPRNTTGPPASRTWLVSHVTCLPRVLLASVACVGWFDFFFVCVFDGPSRLFHSLWAESIQRWGENGSSPRKTTGPPTSRTWLVSHVTGARLEPTAVRWRALKISSLNYSTTGAALHNLCLLL